MASSGQPNDPLKSAAPAHDIVVIGASAGGVEALSELVAALPADLRAAVFIVIHLSSSFSSRLAEILSQRGPLRATEAMHGEPIVPGHIYVAPPDNHLLIRAGYLSVVRGPKENGHRPSVDALFRTAAATYGPRVVGVILTGYLDCGTAGMLSIKARGGVGIAQDPENAAAPDMPRSAISHGTIDHVVPLHEIAPLIARIVEAPAGLPPPQVSRALMELEGDELGVAAEIVCPLCQGKLTETELRGFQFFRCHVGHAFSLESVAMEQAEQVERALWAALRALEEASSMTRRLAERATGDLKYRFEERERTQVQHSQVLRSILLGGTFLSKADVPGSDVALGDPWQH